MAAWPHAVGAGTSGIRLRDCSGNCSGETSVRIAPAAPRRSTACPASRTRFTSASSTAASGRRPMPAGSWLPIFDRQPTGSIGALAVALSDPNVIYVGTGEAQQRPDLATGDGMYKSTDAGKTWTHLGLRDSQQIGQVVVDPKDANRRVRRGARTPLRPQHRARHFPFDRWRQDVRAGALQGREHRRRRRRDRPVESQHRLCVVVAGAAGAVGERRFPRTGQRPVQVDGRRHHVASTRRRPADVGSRSPRPHRHRHRAEPAVATVRDRRCSQPGRLSIG